MSKDRSYISSLRDEQARATRLRIRQAARALYASKGFTATTITDIADRAGVSPATVYAAFESKAGLVVAMLEDMEESVDLGAQLHDVFETSEGHEQLMRFISVHVALFEDSADVLRAAMRAIEDPAVAALAAAGDTHRRHVINRLAAGWQEVGMLRAGLAADSATDRLWLLTTVEGYLNAVDRLGWTPQQYESWLADLAASQLLKPKRGMRASE